jgi:hypothetical protein
MDITVKTYLKDLKEERRRGLGRDAEPGLVCRRGAAARDHSGSGRAGQGRAGQGRAGQGREHGGGWPPSSRREGAPHGRAIEGARMRRQGVYRAYVYEAYPGVRL